MSPFSQAIFFDISQKPHINTWFRTFYQHTDRERSVQGWVRNLAGDFGSRGDVGGHSEVR